MKPSNTVDQSSNPSCGTRQSSSPDSESRRRLLTAGASLAVSPLLLAGCNGADVDEGILFPSKPMTGTTSRGAWSIRRAFPPRYSAAAGGIGEFLTAKGWDRLSDLATGDVLIRQMQGQLKRHADKFAEITPAPVTYMAGSKTAFQPIARPDLTAAQVAAADLAKKNFSSIRSAAFDWRCHRRAETLLVIRNMLLAWARVHQPYGNPLVDEFMLNAAVAYFHVREALSDIDRKVIEPWLRSAMERNRMWFERITADRKAGRNNWFSHGLCNVAVNALAIDSRADLKWVASASRIFLGEHIEPGGETVDFRGRDALGYQCYSLRGLTLLAQAMSVMGVGLYRYQASPAGNGSMAKAMDFLIPYIEKTRVHLDYVNSRVPEDKLKQDFGKAWEFNPGLPFPYADAYDPRWGAYARQKARLDTPEQPYLHRFPGYNPSWLFNEVTHSLSATYPEGIPMM